MALNFTQAHLAIIPARGGSKVLPKKNIKLLNKKPMIAYTIEAALQSNCFTHIIVSTDDIETAHISKQYGADIPFIRPPHLATDSTNSIDVILHALDFFETQNHFFDLVTLLQPTSPLRNATDIINASHLLIEKNASAVISVCETATPLAWINTLPADHSLKNFLPSGIAHQRRQEFATHYQLNGAIYMAKTELLKIQKSFFSDISYAYIMPHERSVDIDNIYDFYFCETLMNHL